MKNHICFEQRDTGLWHGLLYRNHPTPSGCDRAILALSANKGMATREEALAHMLSGLTPECIADLDIPILTPNVKVRG